MSASLDIIYPSSVTLIRARQEHPVKVSVGGNDTLSYGTTSTNLNSTLDAGESETFTSDIWIRSAGDGPVLLERYERWQLNEEISNFFSAGYNPSFHRDPDNPKRWNAIDFVWSGKSERGTGNRLHTRSLNLTNVGDPPELVFIRSGPKGSPGWGPSGSGPSGWGDGTELEGLQAGSTLGFVGFMAFVPTEAGGSHQAFSVVNGANVTEPSRQDQLTVTLAEEISSDDETIEIVGDMDAVEAFDGTLFPFYEVGRVGCSGNTISYSGRDATHLYGCELVSGDVETIAAGTNVGQTRTQAGGDWSVNTAIRTTGQRRHRIRIDGDGMVGIGDYAIADGLSAGFTASIGRNHFKELRKISNLTATVVGTAGTATITYKVIQRGPDGSSVDPLEVEITTAPNTLNSTNYVKLEWTGGTGTDRYDVLRTATDGTPATTGAIILSQPWIRGNRAVDYGLAPTGQNEVQQITFSQADEGTFRLSYEDEFTDSITYPPTAGELETALEGLSGIGAGNIAVTGGVSTGFRAEFEGALASTDVSLIGAEDENLVHVPLVDQPDKTPKIIVLHTTPGTPASYTEPVRNETGDVDIDGELEVAQAYVFPEKATAPAAPDAAHGKLYAKNTDGRTTLHLRDSTGIADLLTTDSDDAIIFQDLADAKGDMIAATGDDAFDRVAVGANTTVLTADSTVGTGVKWADPQVNRYRQLHRQIMVAQAAQVTGAAVYIPAGNNVVVGAAAAVGSELFYIDSDDWAITGLTTKLRLVAACGVNDTAPAITLTAGLYPVGNITGGVGIANPNFGTVVTGSTIAFATPAANSESVQTYTADFNLPSDGWYGLGVEASGAMTANSVVVVPTRIEVRNV